MIKSETIAKIAPALVKSWGEIENPKHNTSVKVHTRKGTSYTFDYTDLNGIFEEAKKVLKENGIAIMQNAYTDLIEGQSMVMVETMMIHTSGEWMQSNTLKMPTSVNIQDMGGQITYMKRYSLSAMLGIATEKDDDANGASGNEYEIKEGTATEKQLNYVDTLLKKNVTEKLSKEQLYTHLKSRMETDKDMETWTPSQASQAIKILQGSK